MAKETFYFSHDFNARNDDKIKHLLRKHKWEGYGLFWAIIEELYNNANALRLDCEGIAYDLRTDAEVVKSIIHDFGLFEIRGGEFGSISIERRLDERNKKSQKASESAHKRWSQCKSDANALENDANALKDNTNALENDAIELKNDAIIKGIKVKEIKNINIEFDIFWDLYDKKVGEKVKLKKKWNSLTDKERETAINHIPLYKKSKPDKQFRKDPQTYLNNKSFNDEIIGMNGSVPIKLEPPLQQKEWWEITYGDRYKTKEEFEEAYKKGEIDPFND